jgi:hypothetical protein
MKLRKEIASRLGIEDNGLFPFFERLLDRIEVLETLVRSQANTALEMTANARLLSDS